MDEAIRIHERITRMESQFERVFSEAAAEKQTLREIIKDLKDIADRVETRVRRVERCIYLAVGAVAMVEFILKI
jgi:sugar-specific transcriptional regulator TrmB